MYRSIIFSIVLLLFVAAIPAQNSQPAGRQRNKDFTLSVDVRLVTLPVSVADRNGAFFNDLAREHFQIFEDNVVQDISLFKHEDIPLSLGLVIDNSGSMRNKRERVNTAALSFVRESNPEDETFILNFDDEAYLEQDFTSSMGDLVDALDNIDTRGQTALLDAIYLAVDHVQKGNRDKKALLIISDGEDTSSKYGFNKVLERVRASKDITIFAVGLIEQNDERGGLFSKSPSKKAKEALTELTQLTGGHAYFPKSLDEVEELCKRIAHELRNQYTLGYTPKNSNLDGTWRKIEVKINAPKDAPKLTLRTKPGYFAGPTPQ